MERHNRFDEAMKAKLGQLEDEPSARVWAGVRQDIGTIRPPRSYAWPLRMAAGVALLCTTGLAYYLWQPSAATMPAGMALREQSRVKHIVIVPLDRMGTQGNYLAQDQNVEPQLHPAQPRRQDNAIANAPQPKVRLQDSLKALQPWTPQPEDHKIEVVHNDAPKQLEQPAPKAPDLQAPELRTLGNPEVRTAPAIASASTKRSYRLPSRDELAPDNLRKKSGAILGAITNGASSFLGINANYEEKNLDDQKLTAFNADFGLFKIKRVRTIKN
jgi:hypothetical protein